MKAPEGERIGTRQRCDHGEPVEGSRQVVPEPADEIMSRPAALAQRLLDDGGDVALGCRSLRFYHRLGHEPGNPSYKRPPVLPPMQRSLPPALDCCVGLVKKLSAVVASILASPPVRPSGRRARSVSSVAMTDSRRCAIFRLIESADRIDTQTLRGRHGVIDAQPIQELLELLVIFVVG